MSRRQAKAGLVNLLFVAVGVDICVNVGGTHGVGDVRYILRTRKRMSGETMKEKKISCMLEAKGVYPLICWFHDL